MVLLTSVIPSLMSPLFDNLAPIGSAIVGESERPITSRALRAPRLGRLYLR